MKQHETRRKAALELRDRLLCEGRTADARIITNLVRSSATSAGLNRVLSDDLKHATEQLRLAGPPQ